MRYSFSDGKDSDINSLQLSSENDVENESKNETSVMLDIAMNIEKHAATSEQKEGGTGTSKSPDESKHRRGRKRFNVNSTELISPANSIAETPMRHTVKEESPTPLNISISKTSKGKPRKRAALIKLKRGKPRKK